MVWSKKIWGGWGCWFYEGLGWVARQARRYIAYASNPPPFRAPPFTREKWVCVVDCIPLSRGETLRFRGSMAFVEPMAIRDRRYDYILERLAFPYNYTNLESKLIILLVIFNSW